MDSLPFPGGTYPDSGMGHFHVPIEVSHRTGGRVVTLPTIAVFGEPVTEPILGVVTLEEFGLAVDPVNRRLISVPGLLKGSRPPGPRLAA